MIRNGFQAVALIGLAGVALQTYLNRKTMRTQLRLESERYEMLDGREAVNAATLQTGMAELRAWMPGTVSRLEAMELKLNRIERIQETAIRTTATFTVALRDSVRERSGDGAEVIAGNRIRDDPFSPAPLFDTVKVFRFQNDYLRVEGMAAGDSQQIRLMLNDTLLQVVRRGPRKHPWLWILSPRTLVQTLSLGNPDAQIRYSRIIEIQK